MGDSSGGGGSFAAAFFGVAFLAGASSSLELSPELDSSFFAAAFLAGAAFAKHTTEAANLMTSFPLTPLKIVKIIHGLLLENGRPSDH